MARALWRVIVAALVTSPLVVGEERGEYIVIVRVQNDASVPTRLLHAAEQASARRFRDLGVELRWREPSAVALADTRAPEVSIVLMSAAMGARKSDREHLRDNTVATSSKRTGRAYVYCERVRQVALQHAMAEDQVLARVFTHERGHMIANIGHDTLGAMRATMEMTDAAFLGFTDPQRRAIREALAAAMATDAPQLALRAVPDPLKRP